MTNPVPPRTFTRDEFTTQVLGAHDTINDFTKFLMHRFAAFTQRGVCDLRDRAVEPIQDPFARTSAGYGHWRIAANWIRVMTETTDLPEPYVLIEHYLDDDRGPGSVTQTVRMPASFVFGEFEQDADFEQYLRLKAQFEPEVKTSAPRQSIPAPGGGLLTGHRQPKTRREAARVLWVQSRPESERTGNGEHLADPANRAEAAAAYRLALGSLMMRTGLKDIRRSVHDAAHALGLGNDDISEPNAKDQQGPAPKAETTESPYDNPRTGQDPKADPAADLGLTLLRDLAERLTGVPEIAAAQQKAEETYQQVQAAFTLTGKQIFGDKAPKVGEVLDDVATLLGFDKKKR